MKSFQKIAAAAAVAIAAPAFAAATIDANIESDNIFTKTTGKKSSGLIQAGRIEVNVAGRAEGTGGSFVAARGTLLMKKDGSTGLDDGWVQFGNASADLKLGRFEAADLYPVGADALRQPIGLYQANNLRGRLGDRFHGAANFNLGNGLSAELGYVGKNSQAGVDSADPTKLTGYTGFRPVLTYSAGDLTARVGFETGKVGTGVNAGESFSGLGLTATAPVGPAKLTGAITSGTEKVAGSDDLKKTALLVSAEVGAGFIALETGKNKQGSASTKLLSVYGAYVIPLMDIKGASLIPAFGVGEQKPDGGTKTKYTAAGVRVRYDF